MSPGLEAFIAHLRESGYHSRSNKHSNALAEAIVTDLLHTCPVLREKAARGGVVYGVNFPLRAGTADWNVDLVLGPPPPGAPADPGGRGIARCLPVAVEVAVELKTVMTEHRKAVKNRKRDLEAHHEHVHNYNNLAIAGGVLVVNASPSFQSPLRPGATAHRDPPGLVRHCIDELRSVASRGGATGYGLEAKCALVVSLDNITHTNARCVEALPAPQHGDPLHYDGFIHAICQAYRVRFGA